MLEAHARLQSISCWRVEEVKEGRAFEKLEVEWGHLLGKSRASVFNSWEWLFPWYRHVAPSTHLAILTLRDATGALCGILPLSRSVEKASGFRARRLAFLGDSHVGSDYLDVLAPQAAEAAVKAELIAHLFAHERDWDLLELNDLEENSLTLELLKSATEKAGYCLRVSPRFVCPFETFADGETFEAFLKRVSRRDNYLRRRKWLERQNGFAIERTKGTEGRKLAVREFFDLHAQRWAGEGGSSGIRSPAVEAFHEEATFRMASRGWLRFFTLRMGAEAVASVYGLRHREKFIYYQSGYAPAWASKSVGLVLVGESFRDAISEGAREFDFLRGTEAYKSDWTSQKRHTVSVRIWKPGGPGELVTRLKDAGIAVKGAIKEALPREWLEALRRLRRSHERRHHALGHDA
jgi:CelD/BcsL family acetyltransferase involved in cellulose biosynthesis